MMKVVKVQCVIGSEVGSLIKYKLAVMVRRCLEPWRTKLQHIWATAFRSPPSAAYTYVQSTSINWLYRAVGELHSAIRLSLLQARWSGTYYRLKLT